MLIKKFSISSLTLTRQYLIWFLVAIVWIGYLAFAYFVFMRGGPGLYDFQTYYLRANDLLQGHSLYSGVNGTHIYLYPPLLGQALMPLVRWLSFDSVAAIWFGLNALGLVITVFMLAPYLKAHRLWVYALLPIFFIPDFKALYVGQVTPILLALLTGVWVARKNNRPGIAGILLAISVWIKVYPALLILLFIWKRDWRLVLSAIGTGIALALLQILISGPGLMIEFISIISSLAVEGQPAGNFKNSSVLGFAARLFGEAPPVQPLIQDAGLYSATRSLLVVFILGVSLITIVNKSRKLDYGRRFDLEYAMVLVVSMFISSTLWVGASAPLLLAYLLIIRYPIGFRAGCIWFLSFFLVTTYHPILLGSVGSVMPNLVYSLGFFGIFMLWGLLIWLIIREKSQRETLHSALNPTQHELTVKIVI